MVNICGYHCLVCSTGAWEHNCVSQMKKLRNWTGEESSWRCFSRGIRSKPKGFFLLGFFLLSLSLLTSLKYYCRCFSFSWPLNIGCSFFCSFFFPSPLFFIILRKLQCVFQGWWIVILERDRRVKSILALPSITKPQQGLIVMPKDILFNFLSSLPVKQQNSFTFTLWDTIIVQFHKWKSASTSLYFNPLTYFIL